VWRKKRTKPTKAKGTCHRSQLPPEKQDSGDYGEMTWRRSRAEIDERPLAETGKRRSVRYWGGFYFHIMTNLWGNLYNATRVASGGAEGPQKTLSGKPP